MLVHADALGVAASEEGGTRRAADWGGDHEAGELSPFFCESINVGCFDLGGAKAAKVAVDLVIGEDDDEIGLVSSVSDKAGKQKNKEEDLTHKA